MSLPILPAISETIIIRHVGAYEGPINLGDVFAWHPDNWYARQLLVVTRIEHRVDSNFLRSFVWCRKIDGSPFAGGRNEVENPEDLFRESVFATLMRPHSIEPVDVLPLGAALIDAFFKKDRA